MIFDYAELKLLLEEKADRYNNSSFIDNDPVSIPRLFTKREDIESIGFIIATIAWGNRKNIINSGLRLLDIMGNQPHDYILNASSKDLKGLKFVHRTFNSSDLAFFIQSLRNVYAKGGLENAFGGRNLKGKTKERIEFFRANFLELNHEHRVEKHISSPISKSACKRLNMFLRWMVRNDKRKVDFGIWKSIKMSELYLPLDVHTGRVARELGLLNRKQDDWQALEEVMKHLQKFDPNDPCKYDFALFGIGVNELGRLRSDECRVKSDEG
jgi:uncharacterized protein (TIGR02757 family)